MSIVIRRLFIFFIIISILCLLFVFNAKNSGFNYLDIYDINIYTAKTENLPEGMSHISNSGGMIVSCQPDEMESLLESLASVSGVSFKVNNSMDEIIQNLKIKEIHSEVIESENLINYFGYIGEKHNYIMVGGKKVNVQIAIRDETITVGFPIILGGY